MKLLYNRYFPTPGFLAMRSCAFDISDLSIKYGELLPTEGGLKLGRFGQAEIPSGVIVSGKIEKESELIRVLTNLRVREQFRFVRVSLPEEQMYLFTLSLPYMKEEEIHDTILLQIEEHIPLSAVDTIFDFEIISQTGQSLVVQVLAASTSVIESYVSVFKESGLIPLSFELEAQAIARAVLPYGDRDSVMIVDFGQTRTGVSIAQGGRVLFTTTLDIGGATLTSMIAKNFSLSMEEAEKLKRSSDASDSRSADIFPVILNGLSVLRDELTRQKEYWKTHTDEGLPHMEIKQCILCGGDANLSGLSTYLQSSMGLTVTHAQVWTNISDMKTSVPDMSFEDSFSYATVLGLALADYASGAQSLMNVLPPTEKKSLQREYWMRLSTVSLFLISLVGMMAIVLILPSYFLSVSKLALAEDRLQTFNSANPDVETQDLNATIADINTKLSLLSDKSKGGNVSSRIIHDLVDNRPKGITLTSILYAEKKGPVKTLEIHGVAFDRLTLRNYKTLLLQNTDIAQADLPISEYLERTNITFTMLITLK